MTTEKTPTRAKFQARFLPMIAPFMAVCDIRFYLNGFLIERAEKGGVYLVATDGHVLAVIHDQSGMIDGEDRIIIRRDTGLITAAKRATPRGGLNPHVCIENDRVTVANDFGMQGTDMETFVMPGKHLLEGNFPKWKNVLPEFDKLHPGVNASLVDPRFLARFEVACKAAGSLRKSQIRLWKHEDDAKQSITIQIPSIPQFVAVLMPIKDDIKSQQEAVKQLTIFK